MARQILAGHTYFLKESTLIYLGTLGRMVELKCPATQQVSVADGYSFEETLEGQVKAQVKTLRRRVWQLGTSDATIPADQATLMGFASGSWGNGPFVFVSADAPVTNMLTPAAASCMEMRTNNALVRPAGPVNLDTAGWEGRSIGADLPEGGGSRPEIYFGTGDTPVLAGVPVTGSAYVEGTDAAIRLYWYRDGDPTPITSSTSSASPGTGFRRISVTAIPPAGAIFCRLVAVGATRATRPAITWTDRAFAWAAGEGCSKAVIHAMSKSLVLASRDPRGGRYANLSYTITEVG